MTKFIQAGIIVTCTLLCLPAIAGPARQLLWDDLIPSQPAVEDPVAKLNEEQKELVYYVISMLENLPKGEPETEQAFEEIDAAMPTLRQSGIDIKKVLAKRQEIRTAIVDELDGRRVRIPGYLLPLDISGAKVTEFLLVPYIGACIHVPPPPPNQIVYVKVAENNGYVQKKMFDPVWVTGVISVKSMVKDLFLVDGSAGINIGYAMRADQIEPYKE
jgi:hypothetical protein